MIEGAEWSRAEAAALLRRPTAADDKYSRGVVGLRTGSAQYPGAAVLGVEGAWRAGAGMVRYTGPARDLVLARRPETVATPGRAHAWVIGSGTDAASRSRDESDALRALLAGDAPVVVDAGALDLAAGPAAARVADRPAGEPGDPAPAPRILTPHDGEHARLRERLGLAHEPDRVAAALGTARALDAIVLLKGAVTVVAAPDGRVRTIVAPTSWLAAAGTGDVLAGVLGVLVAGAVAGASSGGDAGAVDLLAVAATAAWVHGHAGLAASRARGDGPLVALEVAEAVASVIGDLLAR